MFEPLETGLVKEFVESVSVQRWTVKIMLAGVFLASMGIA